MAPNRGVAAATMALVLLTGPAVAFKPSLTGMRRGVPSMVKRGTGEVEGGDGAAAGRSSSLFLGGRGLTRSEVFQGAMVAGSLGGAATIGVVSAQEEGRDVVVRSPDLWDERIFDTKRRSYIPIQADRLVHNKVLNTPVICVGEIHNDVCHHMAELEIVKAVHRKRGTEGLALGMEMFYRQHQPILDEYVFGSGTLASLKQDTDWDKTWGHKLSHYAKILQYAKTHKIQLVGLNVPIPVVQVVRKLGLGKIPHKLRAMLPEIDLSNEGHRDSFMSMMKMFGGVHGNLAEEALWRLYEAQTLWDEYMAESASNYLKKNSNKVESMVVMAGSAHIENRYGVPDRITRRLGVPVFTVVPITVDFDDVGLPKVDAPYDKDFADWIWYVQGVRRA